MTVKNTKKDNSTFLSNMGNKALVLLLKSIALLPFSCLYVMSNCLYFLNKYIIKYRHNVSLGNLRHSFPEKSEEEILEIQDRFYRHFFDFSMESVKLYNTNKEELQKRIVFKGLSECEKMVEQKNGAIVLAFHYNNWEWCSFVQTQFKHPILMVYNPPRDNKPMEEFLTKSRGQWGGKVIRTEWAARTILRHKLNGEPSVLWLAADQTALATSPFWINFLNREAAFFKGPQVLAKKTNFPIFFQQIKKCERGKYEVEFTRLVEDPGKIEPEEILKAYVQKMEEVIKSQPEYYLWTHNRWKHKRPANTPLIS